MTLSLATRGYVSTKSAALPDDALVFLHPKTVSMQQNIQILMAAVLAGPADSEVTVNLSSDQPTRVSVPASVAVPAGESSGTFLATSGTALGDAVITATAERVVQSTITVVQALPALRPIAIGATELKPRIVRTEPQ